MDEITARVMARDALRREAGLPALDVEKEVRHARGVAEAVRYQAFREAHAHERHEIRDAIVAERRANGDPTFPNGWSGHMGLGVLVERRFRALLGERYGVAPPAGADSPKPLGPHKDPVA